ncbi:MAG: methionine--tRNA ligase [Candidatus Sericytochromatia bacterium]|nr:methionine--tRNA ligase [Candidatus Tanganyikabacteria bacterium]
MNKPTYYVTTAIDYINAAPHLGHAYEKIAADAVARYWRLRLGPDKVFFLTGTDEHGAKIEKVARDAGLSPREWADRTVEAFKAAWSALGITYDRFIRTTDPDHEEAVARIFKRLLDQGDIAKARYEGWYCKGCEEFKLERDLPEDRVCPVHGAPTEWTSEENYVFRISKYRDRLRDVIGSDPRFLQPESRRREILNLLEGFPDVSVSRQAVKWGIPVPGDSDHVIYVWIDALSNYITGVGYDEDMERFSTWWPADLHLVGKDITKFHAIIWPAMLLALGVDLPRQVYGHGWVLFDSAKMSKSTGNVVAPRDLAEKYGADAIRYYLLRDVVFGKDGDFTYEAFEARVNADLANNMGNALNRILTFAERHFDNAVARPETPAGPEIEALAARAAEVRSAYERALDDLALQDALAALWQLFDEVNLFIDRQAPWSLAKLDDKAPLGHVIWAVLESLRCAAIMAWPAVPVLAAKMWEQIGAPGIVEASATDRRWADTAWAADPRVVFRTRKVGPIYPRIGSELAGKAKKG